MSDVIGCYIDLDTMSIKWAKNGVDFGKAYDIKHELRNATFYPAVCLKVCNATFCPAVCLEVCNATTDPTVCFKAR